MKHRIIGVAFALLVAIGCSQPIASSPAEGAGAVAVTTTVLSTDPLVERVDVTGASQAAVARALGDCPFGATKRFCLWSLTSYTGTRYQIGTLAPGQCVALQYPHNNNAESGVNNLLHSVSAYDGPCTGAALLTFGPSTASANLNTGCGCNNQISIIRRPG